MRPEYSFQLSQDELRFVLHTMNDASMLGLDPNPWQGQMDASQEIIFSVVARSLQARRLVQLQVDNSIAIHTDLLNLIGTCAYAQRALVVLHWAEPNENPARFFAHSRDSVYVSHTRPDDVLHLFSLYQSSTELVNHALEFCQIEHHRGDPVHNFTLSRIQFDRAGDLAANGEVDRAIALFAEHGIPAQEGMHMEPIAQLLATVLSNPLRMTLMQSVKPAQGDSVAQQDLMLLHNNESIYMLSIPQHRIFRGQQDESLLEIKLVSHKQIADQLSTWI